MLLSLSRQVTEGSILLGARLTVGDEVVGEVLFDQDYDPGFVDRHPHQLAGIWTSMHDLDGDDVSQS